MDPVSQAAFLAAPGVQALARQVLPQAGMAAPRLPTSFLAPQRGNLGRPPVSIAFSPENVYPSFNVDALRPPQ